MLDINTAFNAVRECASETGSAVGKEILHSLRDRIGIDHFCYLRMGSGSSGDVGSVVTTYADDWHDRYIGQEYQFVDPVVQKGLKSYLPLDWSLVKKDNPLVRQFFGEAAEFGVSSTGLTVPVRDPMGRRALFSLNAGMKQNEFQSFTREFLSDLQYLGHLFHDHMCREERLDVIAKVLTAREVDVLTWAARGKTNWETGRICDLSTNTVKFYIRKATVKLEASNKTHAVAKAIELGLIIP